MRKSNDLTPKVQGNVSIKKKVYIPHAKRNYENVARLFWLLLWLRYRLFLLCNSSKLNTLPGAGKLLPFFFWGRKGFQRKIQVVILIRSTQKSTVICWAANDLASTKPCAKLYPTCVWVCLRRSEHRVHGYMQPFPCRHCLKVYTFNPGRW